MLQAKVTFPLILRLKPLRARDRSGSKSYCSILTQNTQTLV